MHADLRTRFNVRCSKKRIARFAERLGMTPARLVPLIDELEGRGLVERRRSATDRRNHALRLTGEGRGAMARIGGAARAHQEAICEGLDPAERAQLAGLLRRMAERHGLAPGVHPGYRRL